MPIAKQAVHETGLLARLFGRWLPNVGADPVRTRAVVPFEGSGTGRRARDWQSSNESIVSLMINNARALRARCRQLTRNNQWAASAVDSYVSNCVGTGIKPQSQHPNPQYRAAMTAAWRRWTDEADVTGHSDFYGMQGTVCRAELEAGECFIRLIRPKASAGLSVPLQLQLIEADHCDEDKTEGKIKGGVEVDDLGKPVRYWLFKNHPGDTTSIGSEIDSVPFKAEDILHVFKPLRPGQLRGMPRLTPVIVKLHDLHRYDDAELERKKIAAMFAAFIHTNSDNDRLFPAQETITPEQAAVEMAQAITGLEPGLMQVLLPGWDVKFAEPADVGPQYLEFLHAQLSGAAAAVGVGYDQISGDVTKTSFSSIRASRQEIRKRCEQFQHQVIAFQMCRPVWKSWFEAALMAKTFDLYGVNTAAMLSEYNENPWPFLDVEWMPPRQDYVNPVQDVQAEVMQIENNLKSRSQAIQERGYDPEDVDRQIAADGERARTLGLPQKQAAGAAGSAAVDVENQPPDDDGRPERRETIQ